MSVCCILTPVVIAAWPAFGAAVTAAATSLGYTVLDHALRRLEAEEEGNEALQVNLEIDQSELVTDQISRGRQLVVEREGVRVIFSRDPRGRATLCVSGEGRSRDELEALGCELSQRVVQQYVYQRLRDEMQKRQFMVVADETDENNAIHLTVRHWDNG